MTDYRETTRKSKGGRGMQTGSIFGSDLDANAELKNIDPSAPVDKSDGLQLVVHLRHGYKYIGGRDPNHCPPDNADAINVGGFIAGAGAAAPVAAGMTSVPIPGARVAAAGTVAAGGIGSIAQGYLADVTGGFQFSVRARAKKKDGTKWYQLGHALPCVPTAGAVGDAKRDVGLKFYSPPEPGEWDVNVIIETSAGDELQNVTKDVTVTSDARQPQEEQKQFDLTEWAVKNPAKAAGAGIVTLVSTRMLLDEALED